MLGLGQQFLDSGGVCEAAHGLDVEVQLAADRSPGQTVGQAFLHVGVALSGSGGQRVVTARRTSGLRRRRVLLRLDFGLGANCLP